MFGQASCSFLFLLETQLVFLVAMLWHFFQIHKLTLMIMYCKLNHRFNHYLL
jgi:hypothetical protein